MPVSLDDIRALVRSGEAYVEQAIALAKDLARLNDLRRTLPARLRASAPMDEAGYARKLETAYGE